MPISLLLIITTLLGIFILCIVFESLCSTQFHKEIIPIFFIFAVLFAWICIANINAKYSVENKQIYNINNIQYIQHRDQMVNINKLFDRSFTGPSVSLKIYDAYSYGICLVHSTYDELLQLNEN